jgi:hypothetical protein
LTIALTAKQKFLTGARYVSRSAAVALLILKVTMFKLFQ